MLGDFKEFNNIEVNNFQDEDISYVSDFPITHHCGFISFLPILIFIFSLLLCVMAPSPAQQIIQSDKLSFDKDVKFSAIESYVSNVKPMSEYMKVSFRFDEVLNRSVTASGKVAIKCKKYGKVVHEYNQDFKELNLVASPINWSTNSIEVYHNRRIDYDSININFVFYSEKPITETFTLLWESSDPNFILVYAITKVMASASFLCFFVIFVAKSFTSLHATTIRKLIAGLLFFSIFIFDPLSVIDLFQIFPFQLPTNSVRILYFGYFMFYTIAIFSFIGFDREQASVPRMAVSIVIPIILTSITAVLDLQKIDTSKVSIMSYDLSTGNEFTIYYLIIYAVYLITFITSIVLAKVSITPKLEDEESKEVEPHPQTDRFNYYCVATMPFALAFFPFYVSPRNIPYIHGTTVELMLPIILSIMFGLIMDRAHTPTDGLQSGYVQVGDEEVDEDNPIGIETDPNTLTIPDTEEP